MVESKLFIVLGLLLLIFTAGCASITSEDYAMQSNDHAPMTDYILNASQKLKEVYPLAANYPDILEKVPCYCGCDKVGHENNLDCYIGEMGEGEIVKEWDPHGATWLVCADIARAAVVKHKEGDSNQDIYKYIVKNFSHYGIGTPTPEPINE